MQAIFRMGIPVTGKNVFPSNIQGLPTWYEIRVSKDGYTARPEHVDLVVALNPETYAKDVAAVRPGGYLLYDSSWPLDDTLVREGITILGIPFGKMCVEAFEGDRNRTLLRNIAYVGALAALLEIDMDVVGEMLQREVREEEGAARRELTARSGSATTTRRRTTTCPLPFHLERMDATKDSILIDGNTAAALGAVYAGATVGAWYPITPSTSLMEAFKEYCERFRVDPATKQRKYCIIQAEDELAAAGHGDRRGVVRRARVHVHRGPGHLADERVHRTRVLHRDSRRLLRHPAHRAVDRHADAHAAGRPAVDRVSLARRHEAHRALPGESRRSASTLARRGVRSRRAVPDAGVRRVAISTSA